MTAAKIAILNPTTLLGKEIRGGLAHARDLWSEVCLLTADPEVAGTVSEVAGAAAMVELVEPESLEGVDLVICCGQFTELDELLARKDAEVTAIVVSPDFSVPEGIPVVSGVNSIQAQKGSTLISPHSAIIAIAHLLHPLQRLAVQQIVVHVIQPASTRDQEGIDELFEQTRSILSFSQEVPRDIFGNQLAFNLFPSPTCTKTLVSQLRSVLGFDRAVALHLLQGNVFHSLSVTAFIRFDHDPGQSELQTALEEHSYLELVEDPDRLGPIEAAAREELLVGSVESVPGQAGSYWLWAVMDNLTRGGASNTLEIARAVLAGTGCAS